MKKIEKILAIGIVVALLIALQSILNPYIKQPVQICYGADDIYEVYDYTYADNNTTLITALGRIYHSDDCRDKDK